MIRENATAKKVSPVFSFVELYSGLSLMLL